METKQKTSSVRLKAVFILWMALASCTSVEPPEPQSKLDTSLARAAPSETVESFTALPAPALSVESEPLKDTVIKPNIIPPATNGNPGQLLGLASDSVTELLGAPNLIRHDHSVEIWQYKAKTCILDVFLYAEGMDKLVRYDELRRREGSKELERSCFAKLVEAEAKPRSG